MFKNIEQYLRHHLPELTDEQINWMCSVSVVRKVRKKELLLKQGDVCRYKIFVWQGLIRNYGVTKDGNEYIMKFTPEQGWTTDPDSYLNQIPSKFNIEAIEPSEVLLWSRENFEVLRAALPALNAFSESIITRSVSETHNRMLMNLSYTAQERYVHFITSFPHILQRVPLHMVASYLGVSRETLTRIRHAQLSRQKNHSIG